MHDQDTFPTIVEAAADTFCLLKTVISYCTKAHKVYAVRNSRVGVNNGGL